MGAVGSDRRVNLSQRVLLSVKDIELLYGVSRSYAYSLRHRIPVFHFAGVKFRREDVERLLESECRSVPSNEEGRAPPAAGSVGSRTVEDSSDEELRKRYGV